MLFNTSILLQLRSESNILPRAHRAMYGNPYKNYMRPPRSFNNYKFWQELWKCNVLQKAQGSYMVNVLKRSCTQPWCSTSTRYGFEGQSPMYCCKHMNEGMINLLSKKCLSDFCNTVTCGENYDGYCTHSFVNLFPDDEWVQNIRTKSKENIVRDFLNHHFGEIYQYDKALHFGCDCPSRRRIDY